MKTILIFGLAIFWFHRPIFAQSSLARVEFIPEHPMQNQRISLCYRRDSSIFQDGVEVKCKVFFTGATDGTAQVGYAEQLELKLTQVNGVLCGSFVAPTKATGLVAVFVDSLQERVDNNFGEGYWTPLFAGSDVLPGSLSGIADLYASGWPPTYNLEQKKEIARELYEKDFSLHPETKRRFSRFYLATFDIHDARDKALYREELKRYSHYADLNEWELLDVKKYYSLIGEADSANKYEKLVFERYPKGSWALQVNSLMPAIQIDQEKDQKKQWAMYLEFKRTYCSAFPDDLTRKRMNDRLGQLLRGMVVGFSERNDLSTWEAEVSSLDERSRYFTYRRTAIFIAEKVRASFEMNSSVSGPFRPESALWQSTEREDKLLRYAEYLARESSDWYRKYMDTPREDNQIHLSDEEVRSRRALQLALALDARAQVLKLQQNPAEALEVLRDAVKLANYAEPDINEHFIELLVRTNHIDEAKREAARVVSLAKSTLAIDQFYQSVGEDSARMIAGANLEKRLRKEMLQEPMPGISVLNSLGKTVSLSEYRGKTVVLDFWATWCAPCIFGMEAMADVVDRYKSKDDVVFLFVNTERFGEETKMRVSKKLESLGYKLDVFYDPESRASKDLKVQALPTLLVVDGKGKLRFRHTGILMTSGKLQQIEELTAMIELARN